MVTKRVGGGSSALPHRDGGNIPDGVGIELAKVDKRAGKGVGVFIGSHEPSGRVRAVAGNPPDGTHVVFDDLTSCG
ncbi:hypothetical protein HDV00_000755, partial [Rhizophlyctis rosea]